MNIEIANRLVQLRKQNGLSQEALAEKLGISRQAVSKWERAEASPDTDNIILLARLYGVSLDELLQTEDEIPRPEPEEVSEPESNTYRSETGNVGADVSAVTYDIVSNGAAGGAESHDESVENMTYRVEREAEHALQQQLAEATYEETLVVKAGEQQLAFISVLYIILGACFNAWHPAWLLFLLIPIWHSLVPAILYKKPTRVAYPVIMALLYLCLGFFWGLWHPGWVVFLTIPLYYPLVTFFHPDNRD